jgi:ribonuclease VapC
VLIDASALTAIFAGEEDGIQFLQRIDLAPIRAISPLGLWESAVSLGRIFARPVGGVAADLQPFLDKFGIRSLPVTAETTGLALIAYERFGKGRHPARLNFGDCFAYAAARQHRMPLLFKGKDFTLTDIEAA